MEVVDFQSTVACTNEWGHNMKIPQRGEKLCRIFNEVADRSETKALARIEKSPEKIYEIMCCLLRAKRGARLPRPPLDPPSVGSAAFGSVSPSFEGSASDHAYRARAYRLEKYMKRTP